ncbi:hypothetical protein NSE_0114 [Neorickettsia sennetsu str. Miyayama]|uniref:Uncharacterized protein n=1 Tax=Ehrlichia sennetsu (strain ATCC VR-367 / Miyayama) TaxID=222891 RepID=Q2GET2_EHRS3|nr:hypothetical protein NSE_0114 [Neorickettsia sennetsu str. Miyayama]
MDKTTIDAKTSTKMIFLLAENITYTPNEEYQGTESNIALYDTIQNCFKYLYFALKKNASGERSLNRMTSSLLHPYLSHMPAR